MAVKVFQSKTVECMTWVSARTAVEKKARPKASVVAMAAMRAAKSANWSSLREIAGRRIIIGALSGEWRFCKTDILAARTPAGRPLRRAALLGCVKLR